MSTSSKNIEQSEVPAKVWQIETPDSVIQQPHVKNSEKAPLID